MCLSEPLYSAQVSGRGPSGPVLLRQTLASGRGASSIVKKQEFLTSGGTNIARVPFGLDLGCYKMVGLVNKTSGAVAIRLHSYLHTYLDRSLCSLGNASNTALLQNQMPHSEFLEINTVFCFIYFIF